ncbi:hypothetical protein [Jannaschia sp. 2305UL9-9]|uniref:hypothetical protein n=1 Tax=Jannaschia sp. 2305UL9-9 TaxID=3121638 RepID=UPI0035297A90
MLGCAADVRFVFILRDPVERLWSGLKQHYRSATRTGQLDSADLIARFDSICRTPLDINFLRSDYRRTIQELEAAVPAARISYCFFETLLDPAQGQDARADLARFLDIPASALNAEQKVHATASTVPLPADSRSAARRALDPVYVALAEKFGDRIPTVWQM